MANTTTKTKATTVKKAISMMTTSNGFFGFMTLENAQSFAKGSKANWIFNVENKFMVVEARHVRTMQEADFEMVQSAVETMQSN